MMHFITTSIKHIRYEHEGILKTRKFDYVRRKRHGSQSSIASTLTHSSGDTWY